MVKNCPSHGPLGPSQVYRHGPDRVDCKACVDARNKARYMAKAAEISAQRKEKYPERRARILERMAKKYADDPKKAIERVRSHKLKLKKEVLLHYAGGVPRCARCEEKNVAFLCMDHVNNDGRAHRRQEKVNKFYEWAKRNGYPPFFQVLCHNCNTRKQSDLRGPSKNSASSRHWMKAKMEALSHYSNRSLKCALCDETDVIVLTIDHINGGGMEHRRSMAKEGSSPSRIYSWLRRHGYPNGFRVLCQNHNLGERCMGD